MQCSVPKVFTETLSSVSSSRCVCLVKDCSCHLLCAQSECRACAVRWSRKGTVHVGSMTCCDVSHFTLRAWTHLKLSGGEADTRCFSESQYCWRHARSVVSFLRLVLFLFKYLTFITLFLIKIVLSFCSFHSPPNPSHISPLPPNSPLASFPLTVVTYMYILTKWYYFLSHWFI